MSHYNPKTILYKDVLYAICDGKFYRFIEHQMQWVEIGRYKLPDGLDVQNGSFVFHRIEQDRECSCELALLMNRGCQCGGK